MLNMSFIVQKRAKSLRFISRKKFMFSSLSNYSISFILIVVLDLYILINKTFIVFIFVSKNFINYISKHILTNKKKQNVYQTVGQDKKIIETMNLRKKLSALHTECQSLI